MDSNLARERSAFIQSLGEKNIRKVNLVHQDGMTEGIWVAMDDANLTKYDADEVGSLPGQNQITCYLVNMPLGWGSAVWGSKIVARHGGTNRASAYLQDQDAHDPFWDENNITLRESIEQMLKEDKDGEE